MGIITLLTDFGSADGYTAVMHGVILGINPAARVVDVTHEVPPQDIRAAAFILSTVYPYFPPDTIHTVVVDPGVGSERRAIAVRTGRGVFVAPDNGVLSYVLAREPVIQMVHLTNAAYWLAPLSSTFHGRDVFTPVAAHLSRGVPLSDLGYAMEDAVRFPIPTAHVAKDGSVHGTILHVDRFGNLITNLSTEVLPAGQPLHIQVAGRQVSGPAKSYAQAREGELLALFGSSGYLEIAVRNGSAAAALQAAPGTPVIAVALEGESKKQAR